MTIIIKKDKRAGKPELTRAMITAMGNKLKDFKDVSGIVIQAEFKDGSGMRFRKFDDEEQ